MTGSSVEIFRTTITGKRDAKKVLSRLTELFPDAKITLDLADCDRVLRIAGKGIQCNKIIEIVKGGGFVCEVLV